MFETVRSNCENLEFSLRKPFDLLRDQKLVPLIGASGTPVELVTAFLNEFRPFGGKLADRLKAMICAIGMIREVGLQTFPLRVDPAMDVVDKRPSVALLRQRQSTTTVNSARSASAPEWPGRGRAAASA